MNASRKGELTMKDVAIVGIDIAKQIFQLHGAAADGSIVFRKNSPAGS